MFDYYIAFGDSMSIDYYACQDAEKAGLGELENIGAASLLYKNNSSLFPEFEGRDLKTKFAHIEHFNLCIDGATCDDLVDQINSKELAAVNPKYALITLTQGGNDLLHAYRRSLEGQDILSLFSKLQTNYKTAISEMKSRFPNSIMFLTTVFDPTDGTGFLPTDSPFYSGKLPIEFLDQFNNFVRGFSGKDILIADVHQHFLGHGAECGRKDNFWYWPPSPIEPSYRGSSEIRRVWLDAVESMA